MIDCLHSCEAEIFNGWGEYQTLYDRDLVRAISDVSSLVATVLKNASDSTVILSGCGTSGRLAFYVAAQLKSLLKEVGLAMCIEFIIAGGSRALTHSVEAFEDSPEAGRKDLIKAAEGKRQVIFIGITCGLSAPFVAGQLAYCMKHLDIFTPVLLGFNPVDMARDRTIEGLDQTFLTVARHLSELHTKGQGFILNPVIGPEAITGSSRLKGGGATKLLLETCLLTAISSFYLSSFIAASTTSVVIHDDNTATASDTSSTSTVSMTDNMVTHQRTFGQDSSNCSTSQEELITSLFDSYHQVWEDSYQSSKQELKKVIGQAGMSLMAGHHVYYVGWGAWGILGLIDASECPPTFGSDFGDVRGFLQGGLVSVPSFQQPAGSHSEADSEEDETSLAYFREIVLPDICDQDTVVFLVPCNDESILQDVQSLLLEVAKKTLQIGVILSSPQFSRQQLDPRVTHTAIRLAPLQPELVNRLMETGRVSNIVEEAFLKCVTELAVKCALNAISTGAHILKGKVYENYMVDLRLSNSKLLERGIGIVERLAKCSKENAEDAVMRSIYRKDDIPSLVDTPVSSIIEIAGNTERVVPTAIILACKKCKVSEALALQERQPVIRASLLGLHAGSGT